MNLVEITELFLTKKGALKRHGASMGERGRARAEGFVSGAWTASATPEHEGEGRAGAAPPATGP
ncbi:hypothetical protein AB0M50_47835 [Nonomuraea fuscirosea]|jgi:hypothetical protein|uniref:hypothetical protein n=1 Tax=Nonomuraea fuscirosea TaxID=1291556 RepID=UPI000D04AB49|nr:hypothetical protein [Nonomuraea fuscirosea]WSA56461.1 hypothetical protein OIE67_18165 [Nonomuraea fuscirosea]